MDCLSAFGNARRIDFPHHGIGGNLDGRGQQDVGVASGPWSADDAHFAQQTPFGTRRQRGRKRMRLQDRGHCGEAQISVEESYLDGLAVFKGYGKEPRAGQFARVSERADLFFLIEFCAEATVVVTVVE